MDTDWIIEVLGDMKVFAEKNDLSLLAEQLDYTMIIALMQCASKMKNCKIL